MRGRIVKQGKKADILWAGFSAMVCPLGRTYIDKRERSSCRVKSKPAPMGEARRYRVVL